MGNKILESAMESRDIVGYEYDKKYETPGEEMRTYEELVITLRSGLKLRLTTWCSGCMENTGLMIEEL